LIDPTFKYPTTNKVAYVYPHPLLPTYSHFRLPLLESTAPLHVLFLEPFVSIHPTVRKCWHAGKK